MGLSSEMKNLSEDIVASFKQRIKENEELVIEVQKTLDGFRKDHQEMANVLKSNAAALKGKLSSDEKNRMSNYNELITNMQNEISKMLSDFTGDRKQMADELNKFFAKNRADRTQDEKDRLTEFNVLMKSITDEVTEIFKYTNDLLAKFDKEHKEMSDELRKDIANGDAKRLKEYNEMMKGIQNEVKNLKKAIAAMIGDFAQDRGQAAASWKKMSDIIAQLRKKGAQAPAKKNPESEIKKAEVKKDIPAVEEQTEKKKIIPEPVIELSLEEKVENYINSHPDGVRIVDMEEPFGETRMKLGYVAKKLLDEGKVQKQDNLYYPKIKRDKKFNK